MIIGKSLFPLGASFSAVTNMQSRMETLQVQLATGKNSFSLSELGNDRSFDMTVRSRQSRIDAFQSNISQVDLRLSFLSNTMERLDEIEADSRGAVTSGGIGSQGFNMVTAKNLAQTRMDEVVTLLNSEVNGRYLLAGGFTDRAPVASFDAIMNGEGGRDGYKTIVGERKLADAGADGRGRLSVSNVADTVTLSEDGAHPFGYKLSTLSSGSGSVSLTSPAGTPQSLSVQFTGVPVAGEMINVGLTLPDGENHVIEFKAVSGAPAAFGEFQIGADENATAANFSAAMNDELLRIKNTVLEAASTYAAADNFFNAQGEDIMRVDGPPFDSATALIVATDSNTVSWYSGEDSSNARQSVTGRVDESTNVNYGVQANETGFVDLMRSLAAISAEDYPIGDDNAVERFSIMSSKQLARLAESNNTKAGSIELVSLELGIAKASNESAKERHINYSVQLANMLAEIEEAPIEQVAMELLALQTRLQASYQTMSVVSQLTLVNFIK